MTEIYMGERVMPIGVELIVKRHNMGVIVIGSDEMFVATKRIDNLDGPTLYFKYDEIDVAN